ncbi:hypothetical protein GPU89_09650 [Burkholderia cepacia]|nr:hypothetical protein [Burkholderia cepacia]
MARTRQGLSPDPERCFSPGRNSENAVARELRRDTAQSRGLGAGGIARATVSLSCSFDSILRPAAGWQSSNEMHRDVAWPARDTAGGWHFGAAEAKNVERKRLRSEQFVRLLASDGIKNESGVSNFFGYMKQI